ncbi:MAG TPA: serine/threonine-protein kinase [Jatrophihabitantaceae bacterium]|nr:serine/threonine-protein kinase [Jatrophihabitantaceae bacterium]
MDLAQCAASRVIAAGTLIDSRYRLIARLGRGAVADVWRAADERLHRHVALKLFGPDSTDPARERAELELLARLSHPGLVTVFDAGVDDHPFTGRRAYLVMELVDGPTLRQHMVGGPLDPDQVAHFGAQLSQALSYVHGRGVIHRDVKPANILLRPDTRIVKLTDFGMARELNAARITAAGHVVGTANYLSPEQLRGEQSTPASDVYALGLVLLESLTGTPAFPGVGIAAALVRLTRAPEIPMRWGRDWHAVLTRALVDDPGVRPSAAELAMRLAAVAADPDPHYEPPVIETADSDDEVLPLSVGQWQVPPERQRRFGPRRSGKHRRRQAA